MPYDRDEIVRELTAFYKFLVNTHIPDSALKLPPEGGWPELTDEWLSFMGKDSTVNDLIRHLPYIGWDRPGERFPLYPDTFPIDFTGNVLHCDPNRYEVDSLEDVGIGVGKSVLTLANCIGRIGYCFLLDTKRGTITKVDAQQPTDPTDLSQNTDVRLDLLSLFNNQVANAD